VFMSTLTTAAVFLPVLMLKGEIGTLFGPVAFIISAAIFLSLFDAFTVVPMLASRWMKKQTEPTGLAKKFMAPLLILDRIGITVAHCIIYALEFCLGAPWRKATLLILVVGLVGLSCKMLPGMGYLPTGGTNLIKTQIVTTEGTSLDENSRLMKILEDRWRQIKGVQHLVATPNRQDARNVMFIVCDREEDSGVSVAEIARQAGKTCKDLPIKYLNPIQFPLFGDIYSRSSIVDVRIVGDSYSVIEPLVNRILDIGKDIKGIVFSYTDLALRKPEVQVRLDLERTAKFGFQPQDVSNTVEAAGGGQQTITQYDVNGRYFYINVTAPADEQKTVEDIRRVVLTSPRQNSVQVPLTSVASVETAFGPLQINHYNGTRASRVQFTIQGRPLSDVFKDVMAKIQATTPLPVGYKIVPVGAINALQKLLGAIGFIFSLSVAVVYLLLVMQFQSFVRPLSIMLSVPLSIIGANVLVNLSGVHFDSFTMLGYIMMVGLVVKNAIILITYAIQLIERGIDRDKALTLASQRRMRPIFMTAISMVLGMLPLALKHGAGAEIYNGLAMAVVGGLSVATLFTLIFIPVVYTILDDVKNYFWKIKPVTLDDDG
ncbi:MAG: efflux RND transporter permease subunit, partial [Desulfomonilaceae bacterium]